MLSKIEKYVLEYPFVKEVYYQESLLFLINENVRKISLFLLVISSFLFLIAITIINNTIRLVYLFKEIPYQDYAAYWCYKGLYTKTISSCRVHFTDCLLPLLQWPSYGTALS